MDPGWGCAQRRPLRSLAHILTLVDPMVIILLDDDTYLNYNLLMKKYGKYLTEGAMIRTPLVIGELTGKWGDTGHLTKWGIFSGGAGYVLGRKAIDALLAYEIKYFPEDLPENLPEKLPKDVFTTANQSVTYDEFRSINQMKFLSVLKEGYERSSQNCNHTVKG
jgi:hypothetical protein